MYSISFHNNQELKLLYSLKSSVHAFQIFRRIFYVSMQRDLSLNFLLCSYFSFSVHLFWVVFSNLTDTIVWNWKPPSSWSELDKLRSFELRIHSLFLTQLPTSHGEWYQSLCQGAVLLTLVNDTKLGIAWVVQSPVTSKCYDHNYPHLCVHACVCARVWVIIHYQSVMHTCMIQVCM